MTRLITTSAALALLLAGPAAAQQQAAPTQDQQMQAEDQQIQAEAGQQAKAQQQQMAGGGFVQPGEQDMLASRTIGAALYAPQEAGQTEALGQADYVTVDVGGFLGIGTREVAIAFDEMTILRDAGWGAFQVHVAATRETLEQMREHDQAAQ